VAAGVSDKCARVPSLINACNFSADPLDEDRQYVVQYLLNSAAGFYVFEVRLTSEMILKCVYIVIAVAFALTTKVLSS